MKIVSNLVRLAKDSRGIAAVEFAFVAPVMLLFIIAIMELARLFLIHNAMTFAADETARAAMVRRSATVAELETLAKSFATMLEPERTVVNVTVQPHDDGWYTNISVQYEYRPMVSLLGLGEFDLVRSTRVNRRDSF